MHKIKYLILPFIVLVSINCAWAQCNAHFNYTYNPALSQPEQSIYLFADNSTGEDSTTTYEWSFGTGDFSSLRNPAFTYEPGDSGLEQVCLTIHNADNGCNSQYCSTLHVDNLCIAANYSYDLQGFTCNYKANICGTWDSIHWDFGDGTQAFQGDSIAHTYTAVADSYYVCVEVMLSSECQNLYPCKVIYCQEIHIYPAGFEQLPLPANELKIYPNPSGSYIQISEIQTRFPANVKIIDVTGKTQIQTLIQSPIQRIKISDLDAGVYVVIMDGINFPNYAARFIKQ